MKSRIRTLSLPCLLTGLLALATSTFAIAGDKDDDGDEPFGAAVVIIELTDNDIELQVFADAFDWNRLRIYDPKERQVFDTKVRGRPRRPGGLSELAFASEPSHFPNDEEEYDKEVEDFLKRWPEGFYEFEGKRLGGLGPLEGEAYLSHVLAALPTKTTVTACSVRY